MRRVALAVLAALALARAAGAQSSWPQKIRDIRVFANTKTDSGTVIELSGIAVGDEFTPDQLDKVKGRLINAGLFSDVNVYYEPYQDGIRLNLVARDKFAWFAAPTFSASAGNVGGGIAFGHTNLFGRNKKLLVYAALFNSDSRFLAGYMDPAVFGSNFFWRIDGGVSRSKIDEFNLAMGNADNLEAPQLFRRTPVWQAGAGLQLGMNLPAHMRASIYYRAQSVIYERSCITDDCATMGAFAADTPLGPAPIDTYTPGPDGTEAYLHADLGYDSIVNTWGIRTGLAFGAWGEIADELLGSRFSYWKAGAGFRLGFRFLEEHNVIVRGGFATGKHLPFVEEFEQGGSGLRGFNYREFRGDTSWDAHTEYYIPIFWLGSMAVRGLLFYDTGAAWWQNLGPLGRLPNGTFRAFHPDGTFRDFLPEVGNTSPTSIDPPKIGFDRDHWHNGLGAGMRLYLKSINIPLLGFDFGYGVESHEVRFYIALGLTD